MTERAYNPSLDGIRALAVTAVLLYHGGTTTGGFLGVDVFFVLSGFLICGLLLAEMRTSGTIALGRFWGRRARRLVPALVLVALAVALMLPLLADDLPASLPVDVISAVTYTSNWWFIVNGQAYAEGAPTPVLHTWSLAIEEQWYLLFPLILLGLALAVGRQAGRLRRSDGDPGRGARDPGRGARDSGRLGAWLGPVLLGGAALSAAWTAWLAHQGASLERVYFGTDTRVQALLVGAALAAFLALPAEVSDTEGTARPGSRGPRPWSPSGAAAPTRRRPGWRDGAPTTAARWRGALGWVGLVGILALVLVATVSATWLPRGGFLAIAILSALLIASVAPSPAPWSPAPLLSWRPFVAVGLVSYGLYLWHFPVYLWLTPERVGLSGWSLLALRVAVTAALAVASYVLVEQPIRRGGGWAGTPVSWTRVGVVGAVAVAVLLVALVRLPSSSAPDSLVALQALATTPVQSPSPPPATQVADPATQVADPATLLPSPGQPTSSTPTRSAAASPRAEPEPVDSVLLVGDSIALSLLPAGRAAGGPQVNIATRFGCGTVPYVATAEGLVLQPEQPLCGEWDEARAREIAAQPADLGVLFLGPWELYDRWVDDQAVPVDSDRWLALSADAYRRVLGEMTPHVGRIAVVKNFCHGAPDEGLPVESMYRAGRYAPVVNDEYRMRRTNEALDLAVREMSQDIQVVDLGDLLCRDGYTSVIDGLTLHTDGIHFSDEGGEWVWRRLARELGLAG